MRTAGLAAALGLAALLAHGPVLFGRGVRLALDQRLYAPWRACTPPGEEPPDPGFNWLATDSNFWYLGQMEKTAARLAAGSFPAWDPVTLAGTPLAAQMGTPPWYPPFWLLLLGDPVAISGWLAALHMVLAGLFQGRLLARLGCGPLPCLAGALGFGLGPWLAFRANQMTLLASAAWAPLALEMALRVGRGEGWRPAALLGLALGMSLAAGMPQLGFVALWGALALGVWVALGAGRPGLPRLGRLAAGAALGGLLAAPALLPTFRLYRRSVRPELGLELALPPAALAGLLSPELFGGAADLAGWPTYQEFPPVRAFLSGHPQDNPLENCLYPGAALLALAALGLLLPGRRGGFRSSEDTRPGAAFFWLLGAAALLLALRAPPLPLLYRLPGLGPEEPRRLLLLFHLGLGVAAALTLERLLQERPALAGPGLFLIAAPLPILLAGWLLPGLGGTALQSLVGPLNEGEARRLLAFERLAVLRPALAAAGTGLGLVLLRQRRRLAAGILLAVLGAELLAFFHRANPAPPGAQFAADTQSGTLAFLKEETAKAGLEGPPRLLHVRSFHALQGNLVARFGIPVLSATHPLPSARLLSYLQLVEESLLDPLLPRGVAWLREPGRARHPLLAAARVGWFCCTDLETVSALEAAGLRRLYPPPGQEDKAEGVALLAAPGTAPRARLVHRWRPAAGPEEARQLLAEDPTMPVVEGPAPERSGPAPALPEPVRWLRAEPERLELEVDAGEEGGILLLADGWYPGWSAAVDGAPAPLYPANLAFRAVPVGPGRHRLVLRFHDPDLGTGLALGAAAAAAAALALCRGRGEKSRAGADTGGRP